MNNETEKQEKTAGQNPIKRIWGRARKFVNDGEKVWGKFDRSVLLIVLFLAALYLSLGLLAILVALSAEEKFAEFILFIASLMAVIGGIVALVRWLNKK